MVSTKQAAKRLNVSMRQVARYVNAGLLKAKQFGDYSTAPWVISEESLERLATQREARLNQSCGGSQSKDKSQT